MSDSRNGMKKGDARPAKKNPNAGGVFGLMSKRRWVLVVVFLSSVTWSYTAGPPLSQSYISNRYFTDPNRFDYNTEAVLGDVDLVYSIFKPKFWQHTWIWQAGAFFGWTEGPTWFNNKLFFSDTISSRIYSYHDYQGTQIEMENAGNATNDQLTQLFEPGSNGLLPDPRNTDSIFIAQHASRRIVSYNVKTGASEIVASEFEGKKLNSPNDMTLGPNKEYLYFTDPVYGLQLKSQQSEASIATTEGYRRVRDERSELGFSGVYRVKLNQPNQYKIELVDKSLERPNGIEISQVKGKTRLYVTNSLEDEIFVNVYDVETKSGKAGKLPVFAETWDTRSVQAHLKESERFVGNENKRLAGWADGLCLHPDASLPYLMVTCPEGKLCIINEETGRLEAAIKFADGVILTNCLFGGDGNFYLTANGNLWHIEYNKN